MTYNQPQVAVVDFHHARGPEVEFWLSNDGQLLYAQNDWDLLPFMALTDGAHASAEDFSYFTLLRRQSETTPSTSLFGIACTRQINATRLKNRSTDVTRSTVQKSVVVLTEEPQHFGQLRERLSAVTNAWFAQEDFSNVDILQEFQASLSKSLFSPSNESDDSFGLSLREMIHDFKHQTLVLFKCLMLQRKMLFFGSRCERLCMMQFALISLIPGLIRNLQDCADPALDSYAQNVSQATSLRTSDRNSLLAYMGLPVQLFGKGSFFGPYTPLQQLDILADSTTKSYIVGSTNSLLLQQKEKYSDILVNLDESNSVTITSPTLRTALSLSAADRRWIDFLTQTVNETWDPDNPSRPRNHGYTGSEEFIRLQFEEYLLALLSSTSFKHDQTTHPPLPATITTTTSTTTEAPLDPTTDFSPDFLTAWSTTPNYALFTHLTTSARIYDIIEPRHPTAGSLSVEDVQRRLAQQVAELHLDDRVREGRQVLNKHLASGRERVTKLWAEVEARRARSQHRSRSRDPTHPTQLQTSDIGLEKENQQSGLSLSLSLSPPQSPPHHPAPGVNAATWATTLRDRAAKVQKPDTTQMQASARENATKAGAYLTSWGSWAKERGKEWQEGRRASVAGGTVEGMTGKASPSLSPSGLRGGSGGL